MGFYDRDYLRRDRPSFLATMGGGAVVCKWLIAVNIALFVLQLLTQQGRGEGFDLTRAFWLDTSAVKSGEVWRLLTYAFVHDPNGLLHIAFNLYFLYIFGIEIEGIYGSREFLAFYLTAAVVGGLAFLGWTAFRREDALCLGSSGAILAVMVLFAMHYPRQQILLFFLLPIPVWLCVAAFVALDTLSFLGGTQGATAVVVHLAGAAFGFVYYRSQGRLMNLWESVRSWRGPRSRPRLRVYREEPSVRPSRTAPAGGDVDEHLEAKLDAVLEKVARTGQASLTEHEKQLLLRASEIFRRRRS